MRLRKMGIVTSNIQMVYGTEMESIEQLDLRLRMVYLAREGA